jgi:predicted nucleic acid-binding protein
MSSKGIMRAFDTSSIVYAWDNYPIQKFPRLWTWIAHQLAAGEIVFPSVVIDEVRFVSPDCHDWLAAIGFQQLPITEGILMQALAIKGYLGIENPRGTGGVGENDIFIVCAAAANGCGLVSNEAVQAILPANRQRYKMPAVCGLRDLNVNCINFLQYLNSSQGQFG